MRDEIGRDPNIPFPKDNTSWDDDITGLMKERDKSIEDDEAREREYDEVKELPTADVKTPPNSFPNGKSSEKANVRADSQTIFEVDLYPGSPEP